MLEIASKIVPPVAPGRLTVVPCASLSRPRPRAVSSRVCTTGCGPSGTTRATPELMSASTRGRPSSEVPPGTSTMICNDPNKSVPVAVAALASTDSTRVPNGGSKNTKRPLRALTAVLLLPLRRTTAPTIDWPAALCTMPASQRLGRRPIKGASWDPPPTSQLANSTRNNPVVTRIAAR